VRKLCGEKNEGSEGGLTDSKHGDGFTASDTLGSAAGHRDGVGHGVLENGGYPRPNTGGAEPVCNEVANEDGGAAPSTGELHIGRWGQEVDLDRAPGDVQLQGVGDIHDGVIRGQAAVGPGDRWQDDVPALGVVDQEDHPCAAVAVHDNGIDTVEIQALDGNVIVHSEHRVHRECLAPRGPGDNVARAGGVTLCIEHGYDTGEVRLDVGDVEGRDEGPPNAPLASDRSDGPRQAVGTGSADEEIVLDGGGGAARSGGAPPDQQCLPKGTRDLVQELQVPRNLDVLVVDAAVEVEVPSGVEGDAVGVPVGRCVDGARVTRGGRVGSIQDDDGAPECAGKIAAGTKVILDGVEDDDADVPRVDFGGDRDGDDAGAGALRGAQGRRRQGAWGRAV
jgi:hypothetical protein